MTRFLLAMLAAMAAAAMCNTAAMARRGGGSWLDSPGYQRALHESRRARTQQQLDQLEVERRRALHRKKKTAR